MKAYGNKVIIEKVLTRKTELGIETPENRNRGKIISSNIADLKEGQEIFYGASTMIDPDKQILSVKAEDVEGIL